MKATNANKKWQRLLSGKGAVAISLYIAAIIALLTFLCSLEKQTPQIRDIRVNPANSSLEITGENLNPNIQATLIHQLSQCRNVIAEKYMWERVFDVKVKGSTAWALCRNVGLVALDISNPHQPQILRTIHINRFLWHLKIKGNTAYIACGKDGVVVCDISSPAEAKILYEHNLPHYATDISIAYGLIYTSNGKDGISTIDPEKGKIIWHREHPGTTLRIIAHAERLFILSRYSNHGYLHIYSLQDNPKEPELIEHLKFPGSPRDYVLNDNRLYLANGKGGIGVVEIAENNTATYKIAAHTNLRSHRLSMYKEKLVIFTRTGEIALFSIGEDGNLLLDRSMDTCGRVYGASMFRNYAVLATNMDGIKIVDLENIQPTDFSNSLAQLFPMAETLKWRVGSSGAVVGIANVVYYLKYFPDGKLRITDELIYPASNAPNALYIKNNRIYVGVKNSGLHVARILPDGTLRNEAKVDIQLRTNSTVHNIETHENNLYICTSDGLKVLDISDPDQPVYQADKDMSENVRSITFGGGFAYISSYGNGIKIAPIGSNNDLGPYESINFPRHLISGAKSLDIAYIDGFLFAACGYRGLLSIDVRNPLEPVVIESIEIPGYCKKVELNQGILGVMSQDYVYLFDVEDLTDIRMLGMTGTIKDFYVGENKLLLLHHEGIISSPRPKPLQLCQKSATKLIYRLPLDASAGSYNLFLNLNNKHSELKGSLINTPDKATSAKWGFVQRVEAE
jgi:hypothetical protein